MSPIHHPGRRLKRAQERMRFATFRLKCYLWTEKTDEGPFEGFGFAADISETGAGLYLGMRFNPGTQVRIAFESETAPTYRGVLMWCQRYTLGQQFFGHPALDHRVGIRLQFISEAERQRYLEYYRELSGRVLLSSLKAADKIPEDGQNPVEGAKGAATPEEPQKTGGGAPSSSGGEKK